MGAQTCAQICAQATAPSAEDRFDAHLQGDAALRRSSLSSRTSASSSKLSDEKVETILRNKPTFVADWHFLPPPPSEKEEPDASARERSQPQAAAESQLLEPPPETVPSAALSDGLQASDAELPSHLPTENGTTVGCSTSSGRRAAASDEAPDIATVAVTPQWATSGRQLDVIRVPAACLAGALSAEIAAGLREEEGTPPFLQLLFSGKVLAPETALADLAAGENMVIDIVRLNPEFQIQVDRSEGGKLGIDVDFSDEITLLIDAITPGLIQDWNDRNPTYLVRKLDRIVEVNGLRGDYARLVEECRKEELLTMVIKRSRA